MCKITKAYTLSQPVAAAATYSHGADVRDHIVDVSEVLLHCCCAHPVGIQRPEVQPAAAMHSAAAWQKRHSPACQEKLVV